MYLVILADGRSRQQPPSGHGPVAFKLTPDGRTILERAAARLAPLVDALDVVVVTDRRHGQTVRGLLPTAQVLAEPIHRNTAASIVLATVAVDRPPDEPMLVVMADHDIADEDAFRQAVATMADAVASAPELGSQLVAFGVTPTESDPSCSYIRPRFGDAIRAGALRVLPVEGYEAHPTAARAQELFEAGTTYSSAGVFLWRRGAIRAAIERYTPLLTLIEPAFRSELALTAAYDRLQPLSIDETVMAGAGGDGAVVTVPLDVGWREIRD
ncbi:MAG TPA: NTP transferase domain-containing protein [Methylomirabilota bacterium]|nr:NTP transferase domain-containing protein [Methylomirabilota bacterium]